MIVLSKNQQELISNKSMVLRQAAEVAASRTFLDSRTSSRTVFEVPGL